MSLSHPFIYFAYGLLYIAVIALWLPTIARIRIWIPVLIASIVFGVLSYQIELIALIPILFFYLAIHFGYRKKSPNIRMAANVVTLIMGIGLMAHCFPGFNQFNAIDQIYFSQNAVPYSLFLSFDKPLVGILLLGMGSHVLISHKQEWRPLFQQIYPSSLIIIFSLIVLALLLGFIRINIKLPLSIFIWTLTNLLFVVVAEEAFFRAFIQKRLMLLLKDKAQGIWIAIFITALLFGVAHFPGGIKYMVLATVAGIGYGWIYVKTNKIEASILTHFGLNLIHFVLFTYPMVNSGK